MGLTCHRQAGLGKKEKKMNRSDNNKTIGGGKSGVYQMGQPDLAFKSGPGKPVPGADMGHDPKTGLPMDLWNLEKRMFLNQIVTALQGGEEPDVLFPILKRWEKDIVTAYRNGKLSVAANDTLFAFLEAHSFEHADVLEDRFMVMDDLHHALWQQSEFSEDLSLHFGFDPFGPDMSGELMDTTQVESQAPQFQRLISGIGQWLLSSSLPAHYEIEMLTAVSQELARCLDGKTKNDPQRFIYSAVYKRGKLKAFSRFRKEGRNLFQDCRGSCPSMYAEGAFSSGELLSIWYFLMPATRFFSGGGSLIIDNAMNSDRAGLFNLLYFRPLGEGLGFQPVKEIEHVRRLFLFRLRERASRLQETAIPNLEAQVAAQDMSKSIRLRLKALAKKTDRMEKWLRKTKKIDADSRMVTHLTLLEEEWRLLAREVAQDANLSEKHMDTVMGTARDLYHRSLYDQWDFTFPI